MTERCLASENDDNNVSKLVLGGRSHRHARAAFMLNKAMSYRTLQKKIYMESNLGTLAKIVEYTV